MSAPAAATRVAVLMGGPSAEHDVSRRSGQGVAEALTRRGWEVERVVIPRGLSLDEAGSSARRALIQLAPEVVFIALHGTFGEDGGIQRVCEELRLPYTGSGVAASQVGMDKIASRSRCVQAGLSVPRWHAADRAHPLPDPRRVEGAGGPFRYPLVVKPASQGSSIGVSVVSHPDRLDAALGAAWAYGPVALIEEYVLGREVTVGVVGETALPVIEIRPRQPFFDYTAKYTAGVTDYLVPAPLEAEVARQVQAAGLLAHRALGCRHVSRADLILRSDNVPVLLEVNTIPGFTPTSLVPKAAACAGMSYDELCERLVLMALPMPEGSVPVTGVSAMSAPAS